MEKEMVTDPSTGEMVTAPEYGGTLTFANKLATVYIDSFYGGFAGSTQSGFTEKLGIATWEIDRDVFNLQSGYVPLSVIRGSLAESWEQPDPTTYIFHLRKGVHWHDKAPMNGRELTADDVVFNWHRMMGIGEFAEAGGSPHQGQITAIPFESVTATDRYTVVFKTTEAQQDTLRNLVIHHAAWVYPPEVIREHGNIQDWRHSVGTGPYMLTDVVEGVSMTFTRNPDYWGYDEKYPDNRLPYIDELTGLIMTEEATIVAALRSGSIDYIGLPGGGGAFLSSIDQAESLRENNPELVLTAWAYRSENAVQFKMMEPPFNDVNVRAAMQMALDLESINDTYYKGFADTTPRTRIGDALAGYTVPFDEWPEDLKGEYAYNPQEAERLLDAAGYPRGADGIRFKTDLTIIDLLDVDYYQLAAEYWKGIGVDVGIILLDRPAFIAASQGLTYEGMSSTVSSYDFDALEAIREYHSSSVGKSGTGASQTGLQDPVFDALFDAAQAADNVEEQQRVVREIDLYLARIHALVWSPKPPQFNVNQSWVKGYNGEIDLGWGDRNAVFSRIWIDQDLKREMGH
jgi:peptide/nickel transport system substrate-binding protein